VRVAPSGHVVLFRPWLLTIRMLLWLLLRLLQQWLMLRLLRLQLRR